MDEIFGLPMNVLLGVMLVLLAVTLTAVVYVALRDRLMFLMGVRNIPRRIAQTVLIVLGLMLSTLIITAAFTTGDTVDHSITLAIYRSHGHLDEAVQFESQENSPAPNVAIPQADFELLEEQLSGDPNIDGMVPVLLEQVPVIDPERRQSAPDARFLGVDETRLEAFPDIEDLDGNPLDLAALAEDEVFVNESLAGELDTQPGAAITVYYENEPIDLRVKDIARDRGITGAFGPAENEGLVTRLSTLQRLLDRPDEIDIVAISNTGGVRDSVARTAAVEDRLDTVFEEQGLPLGVAFSKQENLQDAELAGNGMMTFFLIFGVFSIAAGMLLIVMIFVMLAAERKSELGMARALGTKRRHLVETFLAEGMGYNLVSAFVGAALGVGVAFGLTGILAALFTGEDFDLTIEPTATPRSLIISYSIGVVLTFCTVAFSSWRVSRLNIVRAIRDLPEPPARPGRRSLVLAFVLAILSLLLIFTGVSSEQAFPFGLGFSLAAFAAALVARFFRLPERPVFTAVGLFVLIFWVLMAGDILPVTVDGGPEMFILSGIVMVASASFLLVYNADLVLAVISLVGGRFGRLLPSLRMAVAYPLATKFRTGMTLAMISLVVFALTMMSMMNSNFERVFLDETNRGGWDVEVRENSSNALPGGLVNALERSDPPVETSGFAAVGSLSVARPFSAELCQPDAVNCDDPDAFDVYMAKGADAAFFEATELPLQARATGYGSDREVWDALAHDPTLAVIDANALGGGFIGFGAGDLFQLRGLAADLRTFEPVSLLMRDSEGGGIAPTQVIGVLTQGAGAPGNDLTTGFFGLITSRERIEDVFGEVDFTNYYVRLAAPGRAEEVARDIESALLTSGAQASSIRKDREEQSALVRGFFYLVQAFAGLGLVVGLAALGVVAFRSVVERRQQIGMLRAIGYTRGAVALSFLMESAFIALLGVLSGIGLAILLASFLLRSDEFDAFGITSVYIPWAQISLIGGFALLATLLMTYVPSRGAASVPIAEALRYE